MRLGNLVNVPKQKSFKSTGSNYEPAKPATKADLEYLRRDVITEIEGTEKRLNIRLDQMATKKELKNFATKDDLKNFATKDDLAVIVTDQATMKGDINDLKNDVSDLNYKFDRIDRTQNTMLEILDENTQILKEIRRLPERVDHLEEAVFHR